MNTKFVFASMIAAVSGLAGLANTASAGTDIHLNIGIGARPGPVIVAPRCDAPVVVVPAAPAYGYGREMRPAPAPHGFWKDVSVKVWVPAEWVVTRGHHGREVRTLRPGYFTYRTERVWVADTGRPGDYGRGPGHGYAYGHGRG